ncbi:hypothetical protein FA15DRAFT_604569, partial [Coprinopsis marcescibilis]
GASSVCTVIEDEYCASVKKPVDISLNHNTLRNLTKGGTSIQDFNAEKRWLTKEETERVIQATIEFGEWGHPFSYSCLEEQVNSICRARLGKKFPSTGVGKRWSQRFVSKFSDQLHIYCTKPLDNVRSRAVNKHTNNAWFDLVETVQLTGDNGGPIAPECTWAMDETGFQPNSGEGMEYVIGRTGKAIQYQQRSGSHENITVLVTIGGNGTALQPLVLYSGKSFQSHWIQEDPAKALYVFLSSFTHIRS